MKLPTRPEEPAKPAHSAADRGVPPTYAAHARRTNLTVRVLVKPVANEAEELREHGYGHGV
jgi:hypothetical protein